MRFSIYQDSLIGGRGVNQDRMGYCFTSDALFMVLADGMGGHLRGEVAAQITLQACAAAFQASAQPRLADPEAFLDSALRRAHREILRYQSEHHLPEAPRTTVVACVVQDERAWWAHAGDSRLYWVRGGRVLARTQDHSKVQSLVSLGLISPKEHDTHPERNKVLNCLGSPFDPLVEIGAAPKLHEGDALLLCSDGVWAAIDELDLCAALRGPALDQAVPMIVRDAVARDGPMADNATALAMSWGAPERADSAVSSQAVPPGAMTTTIALVGDEAGDAGDALSEEEIERTIREIREAIERSGGGK